MTARLFVLGVATGVLVAFTGASVATAAPPAMAATPSAVSCTMTGTSGLPLPGAAAGSTAGRVDVLDSLAQVLPAPVVAGSPVALPGASEAKLCSARNAFVSFQIEVSAGAADLKDLSLSASSLKGPGGVEIAGTAAGASSNIQLSREDYVPIVRMSDSELSSADGVTPAGSQISRDTRGICTQTAIKTASGACRFPDILVPDRDAIYGAQRKAFAGLTVTAGQNRTVWVDVFVPAASPAGAYSGTVTVSHSTGSPATVPVALSVVEATLAKDAPMHTVFFSNRVSAENGLYYQHLAELGLNDRISVVPQGEAGSTPAATVKKLLDGTDAVVRYTDAAGVKHGSLTDFAMNADADPGDQYVSKYKSLFVKAGTTNTPADPAITARPWAFCDEVTADVCAKAYSATTSTAWSTLPLLAVDGPRKQADPAYEWFDPKRSATDAATYPAVPAALKSAIGGVVDIVQYLEPKGGWHPTTYLPDEGDRSPYLNAWKATATAPDGKPAQVWAYVSDMSGSAPYSSAEIYRNYPSYGIDQVASEQRAMGWVGYNDALDGLLYYSVDQSLDGKLKSTNDGDLKTGQNGDGVLFYSAADYARAGYDYAASVGGATNQTVPLESIRAKRIRDGQQDYELLTLADQNQATAIAKGTAAAPGLFTAISRSAVTPATFAAAIQSLYRLFPFPTAVTPPGKATNVRATSGSASAYVSWSKPAGGTAPTDYVVTASPGGRSCVSTGTSCTVGGLTNPSPTLSETPRYTFTVVARAQGTSGAASSPSNVIVPSAVKSVNDMNCDGVADAMAVNSSGHLVFLPRTASGTGLDWASATVDVGSGFGTSTASLKYSSLLFAGDLTGDKRPDLVGVDRAGAISVLPGAACTGAVGAPKAAGTLASLGLTGSLNPSATAALVAGVGDFDGDARADLVVRWGQGLYLIPGTGSGTFEKAILIGNGWAAYSSITAVGVVEGHPSIVARCAASPTAPALALCRTTSTGAAADGRTLLYEYQSGRNGTWTATVGKVVGPVLRNATVPTVWGAGDYDGDGLTDLVAVDLARPGADNLREYRQGTAKIFPSSSLRLGGGWDAFPQIVG